MRERPFGRSVAMPALSFQSRALGVTQGDADAGGAIRPFSSNSPRRAPLRCFRPPSTSATVGVGQRPHVAEIICGRAMPVSCGRGPSDPLLPSVACAVGQRDPIEPLADVGGVHGRSRDIDRPAGVARSSQISGDSVEPIEASLSRNLLSHHASGPAGGGEAI